MRERIEECVCGGVVALSGRRDDRSCRTEHHEEFQIGSVKYIVQDTGALDFRRHNCGEVAFGHVHQKPVVDRSRGVDDSAYRLAAVSSMTSQPGFDLVGIGDVDTGGGYS